MKCEKCGTRVYILERLIIDDNCYHKSCYESLTTEPVPQQCPQTIDNNNEIHLNDIHFEESCDQTIADKCIDSQSTDQRIGVTTNSSDDPIDGSDPSHSINKTTSDKSLMDRLVKPQIPPKTFIKTFKFVDNSSELIPPKLNYDSSEPEISYKDIDLQKTSSEKNESTNRTENYEELIERIDGLAVDEMFNKVFKSVTISDNISEIYGEDTHEDTLEDALEEPLEELHPKTITENDSSVYSADTNPFGDEEEDEEFQEELPKEVIISSPKKLDPFQYPDEKNPFDDEDSEETADEVHKQSDDKKPELKVEIRRSSDALNPFGDDEENEDNSTPKPKPRQSLNASTPNSAVPSPTSSLRPRKKRPAPTPPTNSAPTPSTNLTPSIPQVNSSCSLSSSFVAASGDSSRRDSLISSVSSDFGSSVPNSRTPTPLPRLRRQKSTEVLSDNQQNSDQNSSLRSIDSDSELKNKSDFEHKNHSDSELKNRSGSDLRVKKRPAPPIPSIKRLIKGSLAEIEEELNSIGDKLPGVERKGKELEEILLKRLEDQKNEEQEVKSDAQTDPDKSDSTMEEFLSIARERCRLARRQKELMYMKRENKLEEIQADIEYQMRCVISKQAAQKTEEDLKQEEELLKRLVEIIEERNVIIENMVDDENKEVEEFQRIVSKVTPTKPSISRSKDELKREEKLSKHLTIDKNLFKFKDKLKLKEIKEKKKLKKLEKSAEKLDISLDKSSDKNSKTPKPKSKDNSVKHLTLKGTLKPLKKSLGLKSSSDSKKLDKNSPAVSEQTNGSNASISDKN